MQIGQKVQTKHGLSIIQEIDDYTYSIIMLKIKLLEGRFEGERILITESEAPPIKEA